MKRKDKATVMDIINASDKIINEAIGMSRKMYLNEKDLSEIIVLVDLMYKAEIEEIKTEFENKQMTLIVKATIYTDKDDRWGEYRYFKVTPYYIVKGKRAEVKWKAKRIK